MSRENDYACGTPNQAIGYVANGASFDWYYGEQSTKNKIIGLSPEAGYDYVQVKASSDGGATWTPLCGKLPFASLR